MQTIGGRGKRNDNPLIKEEEFTSFQTGPDVKEWVEKVALTINRSMEIKKKGKHTDLAPRKSSPEITPDGKKKGKKGQGVRLQVKMTKGGKEAWSNSVSGMKARQHR